MSSCTSWPCFQGWSGGVCQAAGIIIDVQVARVGTWQPGSPHGSRMGYLQWLISCGLLRLDPGAWGEHLTSQLPWETAWLLVICGSPVYLVVAEFSNCVLWPIMIELMVVLLTFFFVVSVVPLVGSWCYSRELVSNLMK